MNLREADDLDPYMLQAQPLELLGRAANGPMAEFTGPIFDLGEEMPRDGSIGRFDDDDER